MQRKVYFNGKFVPESEARVSIFDSALTFGDMVFEFTRTFNGNPFRLKDHLVRLYAGIKLLEIDCGLSIEEMEAATLETIEINRPSFTSGSDFSIVHNVSRGPMESYSEAFPEGLQPTIVINTWPLTWYLSNFAEFYETGVHAVIPRQETVPARLIDPKIKNRSRIYYQIGTLQAHHIDPKALALFTDEDGFITEGSGSNFFIVKEGELITPEPRNILRGITRQAILEIAPQIGLPSHERNIEPYDIMTADEAFFSTTPYSIAPATRINGMPIGNGKPGPVTWQLIGAWSDMVGVDIVEQAKAAAKMAGM